MNRQVFVNVCPRDMTELSGTVTSEIIAALSLHAPVVDVDVVPSGRGVPGVVVVDASGVDVGRVAVGSARPDFVGGRVEVMKRGGGSVTGSCAILMHEEDARTMSNAMVPIFFM
jgi:hypothetical protein